MRTRGLVIFDAFNTLVTSCPGYEQTFLAGLAAVSKQASPDLLTALHAASEGLDHSEWSSSRRVYSKWAAETLASLTQAGARLDADLAPRVVPALEQLYQAPMAALPDAADCLAMLRHAGFSIDRKSVV